MKQIFRGVFPVVLTPLQANSGIDPEALEEILAFLIDSGVHGLVILGSNGESPYLTDRERRQVIDVSVKANNGRVPVIVGTSYASTDQTIELGRYARDAGASGLLSALPIFYPLEEQEVFAHYQALSDELSMPVLYYHFPMATHLQLTPGQIQRISLIPNIAGMKASIADVDELEEIVTLTRQTPFTVLTGTSMNFFLALQKGAQGVICPIVNLAPRRILSLWEAFQVGDEEKALDIQMSLSELGILFASTMTPHALMKEAMRKLGHRIRPLVKRPLPQLTPEQARLVEQGLSQAESLTS